MTGLRAPEWFKLMLERAPDVTKPTPPVRCPHGARSTPDTCSQCIGGPVKKITLVGQSLLIDGQPSGRTMDHEHVITARRKARR